MPANSIPITAPGTRQKMCASSAAFCVIARAPQRMDFLPRRMAYANSWNSSDQVALRAITTGEVGLFGEIDPTDGGDTSRFMLSTRFAEPDENGLWKANAKIVKYTLNLFSNFSWFTTDPVTRRSIPSTRRSLLWWRQRLPHLQWHAVQLAQPDGVRPANPLRRHQ